VISAIVLALLLGFGLAGALLVVLAREVLRLALGLGLLLVVVAGIFLYYAAPFLAVAQLFVYAGGVLVLLLFALMLLRRDASGALVLKQRHDVGAGAVSVAVFVLVGIGYGSLAPAAPAAGVSVERVADALLGAYLPQFEALALVLLVALVGAIAIALPRPEAPARPADGGAVADPGADAEADAASAEAGEAS
jgi:NADH:ubiquinone oxidoreductase subunit 6 (subunit J)